MEEWELSTIVRPVTAGEKGGLFPASFVTGVVKAKWFKHYRSTDGKLSCDSVAV